jgi:hypothetical protein
MQRHTTSHLEGRCHAQTLAAKNRVTEQLSWLAVEGFFMSCSISWMASLIDILSISWMQRHTTSHLENKEREGVTPNRWQRQIV